MFWQYFKPVFGNTKYRPKGTLKICHFITLAAFQSKLNVSLLLCILFASLSIHAQIFVDGQIEDWPGQNEFIDDDNDGNNIEILELEANNSEDYLFLRITFDTEINLTENNNLKLYIDTDNNEQTGFTFDNLGAELVWNLGDNDGTAYLQNQNTSLYFEDIFFRALPTHTDTKFEILIDKTISINGNLLFPNNTINIKVAETNGDRIPNIGQSYIFTFNSNSNEFQTTSFQKIENNDIRLMSWNTKLDGLLDNSRKSKFIKVIELIEPDIIAFQEVWDMTLSDAVDFMAEIYPNESWYIVKNNNEDNIVVSRYPILENHTVLANKRIQAVKIDLPDSYLKDVLIINTHLKCCGGNSNDAERQFESDAIANFILDLKFGTAAISIDPQTPILIVGDMNYVGSGQQRQTLLNGTISDTNTFGYGGPLDWDDSNLKDLTPIQSQLPLAITWRNDNSFFSPGRLDYIIYTESTLDIPKSYVFQAETLSDETLTAINFEGNETTVASDHFPLIADLNIETTVSTEDHILSSTFQVYQTHQQLTIQSSDIGVLNVYDGAGKMLLSKLMAGQNIFIDKNTIHFNTILIELNGKVKKVVLY